MRRVKIFRVAIVASFLACNSSTDLRSALGQGVSSPDVMDLLDRYIRASAWSHKASMSMRSSFDLTRRDFDGNIIAARCGDRDILFRRDDSKAEWIQKNTWGHGREPGAYSISEQAFWLIDGTRWFQMRNRYGRWLGSLTREGHPPKDPNAIVYIESYGGFCYGFGASVGGEIAHLGQFLKKYPDVRVAGEEVVDGTRCQRVEAKTPYGVFTVWIAPEKGYNALRVRQVVADPADRWQGESLAESPLVSFFYEADSLKFRESDGVFLPVSGQAHMKYTIKDRYKGQRPDHHIRESTTTVTYDQIDVNPDFAALGAFRLALPDGTRVQDMDHPGVTYEIIGGELQGYVDANAVAAIETEIDALTSESNPETPHQPDSTATPGSNAPAEEAENDVAAQTRPSGKTGGNWSGPLVIGIVLIGVVVTIAGVVLYKRRP